MRSRVSLSLDADRPEWGRSSPGEDRSSLLGHPSPRSCWRFPRIAPGSGATHEYRVLAVGLAGNSEPSAIAGAVAPAQGDTEAPVIVSVSPQPGDTVSGVVTIEVSATDDVGVRLITVDAPGMKQRCDAWDSGVATCRWDTRDLPAGPATIYVTASDAMNNGDFE